MGILDDWWRLNPNAGGNVYTVQPGGSFSMPFGQPAPNEDNIPPVPTGMAPRLPEILAPVPPTAPDERKAPLPPVGVPKQPEILAGPRDERTVPPPAAPDPPPLSPRKQPEVTTPIIGPDNKPTSDDRLKPTPTSTAAAAGNEWDRVMKLVKDPKFGGAIAALAKMGGGGKGPAPPGPYRMHMIGPTNPGFNMPNVGSAQQMLEGVMKPKYALGRKRKERQDDPMQFEQDTYDFRRLRGRG